MRLRVASVVDYFTFGYCPAPHTFVEGVRKLYPGQVLLCKNGSIVDESRIPRSPVVMTTM